MTMLDAVIHMYCIAIKPLKRKKKEERKKKKPFLKKET